VENGRPERNKELEENRYIRVESFDMSIRLIIVSATLSFLAACTTFIPDTPPKTGRAGTTSSWGIIYSPCAWCGKTDNIEVHHIIPQEECRRMGRMDLIRNTNNMICLCRTDGKGCHFYIGHHGKHLKFIFTNVMEVIRASQK